MIRILNFQRSTIRANFCCRVAFARKMASGAPQPKLRGTGPEDVEEKVAGSPVFEISIFTRFYDAFLTGTMPGGSKTSLPLLPDEEMVHFNTDYKDWATEPWASMKMPAGPFGFDLPAPSPAPIIRVMHAMSGMDGLLERVMTRTLHLDNEDDVERSFKSLKTLIWYGMAPVSEAQWHAKGLDELENIEEAMAIILRVIDVFRYLRKPKIQGELRQTHNKVWTEIDIFQDAVNALRVSKGEPSPLFSMTNLWQEYVDCHWNFMEKQARAWIFKRLKVLYKNHKDHFLAKFQSGRQINERQGTVIIDHHDMMIQNCLLDLYVDADVMVRRSTEGFISRLGVRAEFANLELPEEQLTQIYSRIENERQRNFRSAMHLLVQDRTARRVAGIEANFPSFLSAPAMVTDREFAHKQVQPEIENPPPLRMESWVAELAREKVERFGFVVYRLVYDVSPETWEDEFLQRLKDGLASGWDGVIGEADIRSKETIHWIDGRSAKIPPGDLGAARAHFKTFSESTSFPVGLSRTVCLGITANSLASFTHTLPSDRSGDFRGFLHVIDASFDPSKSTSSETPGYNGTFKILDQLVWTDLYARLSMGLTPKMSDYWSIAAPHPLSVYVGPTTPERRRVWREMRGGAIVGLLSLLKGAGGGQL